MIRASGILFLTTDRQALFLKRGPGTDHPLEFCFPGGCIEGDETPAEAAIRETLEEAGRRVAEKDLVVHTRSITTTDAAQIAQSVTVPSDAPLPEASTALPSVSLQESVDFTTFLVRVPDIFTPQLSEEHTGYAWCSIESPPEPLHPGCRLAIDRLTMDELGVARAMAAGQLTSPQLYHNMALFNIRITGTGAAYRTSLDEFVWRDPSIYLNDDFVARCNGLQVIMEHPKSAVLSSKEFARRSIGSVFLPYIRGDEVWAIVKIYDDDAIKMMSEEVTSTSPSVVFSDLTVNSKMKLEDGSALLIEGKPSLLDHVAICPLGVWDKGGEPAGVINDSIGDTTMTEEEMKAKERDDSARKDAEEKERADRSRADAEAGEKLDKMLTALDSMSKRMDAMESKYKDADEDEEEKVEEEKAEKKADKRKDADEDEEEKDKAERVVADKKRKDAEEKEKEEAKADSASIRQAIEDLKQQLPKTISDADYAALADRQAKADRIYNAFGDAAPRPLNGETVAAYDKRIVNELKRHSPRWKEADIYALQDSVLAIAMADVYADAATAARSPADMKPGQLRPVYKTNEMTGGRIIEWVGNGTFIGGMRRPALRARVRDNLKPIN